MGEKDVWRAKEVLAQWDFHTKGADYLCSGKGWASAPV